MVRLEAFLINHDTSSEACQLVHYGEGQFYRAHHDYGTSRPYWPNKRFLTFLMYLNSPEKGRETSFTRAKEECKDENGWFGAGAV